MQNDICYYFAWDRHLDTSAIIKKDFIHNEATVNVAMNTASYYARTSLSDIEVKERVFNLTKATDAELFEQRYLILKEM